jgi:hypothetical protein
MPKSIASGMHPSGMTLARWRWPFKTPEERKLVAAWFAKEKIAEGKKRISEAKAAPF